MRPLLALSVLLAAVATRAPSQTSAPTHRVSSPISFFEDAEITTPGTLSISQDVNYTSVYAGHDFSMPTGYLELGLHPRVDVAVGMGYARSQFENFRISGISDTYAGVKFLLVKESGWRPAVAVRPSLEVLGTPSIANNLLAPGRVNFLIPVMIQKSWEEARVYYTGGYLTRGLHFHSFTYELDRWAHVTPSIVVSHSRLTRELELVSDLGLNRSRSDALGIVSVNVSPRWGVYASVGSTFGRTDPNSTRYQVTGGVTVNLHLWGKKPEEKK